MNKQTRPLVPLSRLSEMGRALPELHPTVANCAGAGRWRIYSLSLVTKLLVFMKWVQEFS